MTSAQVVETSVKVTTNSPSQDCTHPDDHNLRTYDQTIAGVISGLNLLLLPVTAPRVFLPSQKKLGSL